MIPGPPDTAAALAYDAFQLLFQAISTEEAVTSDTIREGLSQMKNFTGITGNLSYRGNGDPVRDVIILQIEDNEAKLFEVFEP